jgi:hypothetical protein
MHFYDLLNKLSTNKKIILFVDMDGVIASYNFGAILNFSNKRPLKENIKKIEKINNLPNVELHILSICKENFQIQEKNDWLDKYAPFFKKENRSIISKEKFKGISSAELKANYLKSINSNAQIALIDDDNSVLKYIMANVKNIILFQDSELID